MKFKKFTPYLKKDAGNVELNNAVFNTSMGLNEVFPSKGESKEDFIKRFMKATKGEYPDVKQRFAVANAYWKKEAFEDLVDDEDLTDGAKLLTEKDKELLDHVVDSIYIIGQSADDLLEKMKASYTFFAHLTPEVEDAARQYLSKSIS